MLKANPPLLPALDDPLENTKPPLLPPDDPASGVLKLNDPLDVDFEYPVAIAILPPLPVAAYPADTLIDPPSSVFSVPFEEPADF